MASQAEIKFLSDLVTRIAEITAAHNDLVHEVVALKDRVMQLENHIEHMEDPSYN